MEQIKNNEAKLQDYIGEGDEETPYQLLKSCVKVLEIVKQQREMCRYAVDNGKNFFDYNNDLQKIVSKHQRREFDEVIDLAGKMWLEIGNIMKREMKYSKIRVLQMLIEARFRTINYSQETKDWLKTLKTLGPNEFITFWLRLYLQIVENKDNIDKPRLTIFDRNFKITCRGYVQILETKKRMNELRETREQINGSIWSESWEVI
jgi:hypothetical protein